MSKSEQLEHLLYHPIPTDMKSGSTLVSKIGRLCVDSEVDIGIRRRAIHRISEIRRQLFLVGLN